MAQGEETAATEPKPEAEPAAKPDAAPETETPAEETADTEEAETTEQETQDEPGEPEEAKAEWVESLLAKVPDEHLAPSVKERFSKMAAAEKAKNATIKELKEELATIKESTETVPVVVAATDDNPLAHITTLPALNAETEKFQALLDELNDRPEGGTFKINDARYVYTEESAQAAFDKGIIEENSVEALIKNDKALARKVLRAVPKAEKAIETRSKVREDVRKILPKLYDTASSEHKEARSFIENAPELLKNPESDKYLTYLVLGKRAYEEMKAGTQTVKVKVATPTPKPPAKTVHTAISTAPKAGVRTANTPLDINALRKASEAGNRDAADTLANAFLTPVKK